jgi:DNA helicase HerA-like ATPase
MTEKTLGRKTVAKTDIESSVNQTEAIVADEATDEDLLHRFVSYDSFLGIVKNVFYTRDYKWGQKRIAIQNLVKLDKNGDPIPVRDAPAPALGVFLASADDLKKFFPPEKFPRKGYLGIVRGTKYALPLDPIHLSFANLAILAGIGHGKSRIATLLATQFSLMSRKVLVIDPTGEWAKSLAQLKEKLAVAKVDIAVSCHIVEKVDYRVEGEQLIPMWKEANQLLQNLRQNQITIVDLSLARTDLNSEEKLRARCHIVYDIHEMIMVLALREYAEKHVPYGFQTCIVLEEAHQFVPARTDIAIQRKLSATFSVSTKEYRKYGLGHVFIDQSLKAISEDLQIQTFVLGATTTPADLSFLESRLGKEVVSAAQRTAITHSWIVLGAAAPMASIPWEIEAFNVEDLSFMSTELHPSNNNGPEHLDATKT